MEYISAAAIGGQSWPMESLFGVIIEVPLQQGLLSEQQRAEVCVMLCANNMENQWEE